MENDFAQYQVSNMVQPFVHILLQRATFCIQMQLSLSDTDFEFKILPVAAEGRSAPFRDFIRSYLRASQLLAANLAIFKVQAHDCFGSICLKFEEQEWVSQMVRWNTTAHCVSKLCVDDV